MLPYWLLFALFAGGAIRNSGNPPYRQSPSLLFVAAMVATVAMIGLRFEVGGDWGSYSNFYQRMHLYNLAQALTVGDPGYSFINWLVVRTGLGVGLVNTICALMFVLGLARFCRAQPNPWLAALVAVPYLIVVVAMGYTRQAVAIGFVMWGLTLLERGNVKAFTLAVLAAICFHQTAIVILPIGLMSITRNKFVTYSMLLPITAGLYFVFVQSNIDRLVTNYVDASYASQGALTRVAMNLPPALIFLSARKRFLMSPDAQKFWSIMSIIAVGCLGVLFISSASTAIDRLALYLIPLQMVVLSRMPYVFGRTEGARLAMTAAIMVYSAAILFVWLNYAQHSNYWLPYKNYFWS